MSDVLTEPERVRAQKNPSPSKVIGRLLFALLVVLFALAGTFTGLLVVYSAELPQIEELETYRPATVTELYDVQGRVIGSFALQQRVIAGYDDFPKVLRDAIISVEDKDFEEHPGVSVRRIVGALAGHGERQPGAGRLDLDDAVDAQSLPHPRPHLPPQDARGDPLGAD